jgi:hypothetical protein
VVTEVRKFPRLGGRKDGMILSPVMNVFSQLHVHCVSYHSGDYRAERLVHSITVVLHLIGMTRIGRSQSLGGYGDRKALELRNIKRFERLRRSEFLQLHVDCVSYHSGDYRAESLLRTFTVVLHVRILDKNLSGTRTQLL